MQSKSMLASLELVAVLSAAQGRGGRVVILTKRQHCSQTLTPLCYNTITQHSKLTIVPKGRQDSLLDCSLSCFSNTSKHACTAHRITTHVNAVTEDMLTNQNQLDVCLKVGVMT